MLFRKITKAIENHLKSGDVPILLVNGARQVGKSYTIRDVGTRLFRNYVEINMLEDSKKRKLFADVGTVDDFYLRLGMFAGEKLGMRDETLVFLDEIQVYPELLTLLKFLKQDNRYNYIASGSQLGIALAETSSIPMGSITMMEMYQLDLEEFLLAHGVGGEAIAALKQHYQERKSPAEAVHARMMELFRLYLLVGGLPEAVNVYLATKNIYQVRKVHSLIRRFYAADASKYDAARKLKIRSIYDMIPSVMCNRKRRIIVKDIEGKLGKTFSDYADEFDYLVNSGIALEVKAISTPVFPLPEKSDKNLLKLYMNDVGLLTNILYRTNILAVIDADKGVNLGAVYETAVAMELRAHRHSLYYYDNRSRGEVDFLIDDYDSLSVLPIEVKSGKDYTVHSAISHFIENKGYHVASGIVLSNNRDIRTEESITYLPVYMCMFV